MMRLKAFSYEILTYSRSSTVSKSKVDLANKTPGQAFEANRRLVSDQMERMAQQLAGRKSNWFLL